MRLKQLMIRIGLAGMVWASIGLTAMGQEGMVIPDEEFGPVVRAYLGYLRTEQEVVDDRASRHEISLTYYRRNSNRIRALRQMAINIARETGNDFLPELEAAARNELGTLFEKPPNPRRLRVGEVLNDKFRYLGVVRTGEPFYVFARLDPYEEAELREKQKATIQAEPGAATPGTRSGDPDRPRRVDLGSP